MIKHIIALLPAAVLSFSLYAGDSLALFGTFKGNTRYAAVALCSFGAEQHVVARGAIEGERFEMKVPASVTPGVYRLKYSMNEPDRYIDLIVSGEPEIRFSIDLAGGASRPEFAVSEQNRAWYAYKAFAGLQQEKISRLILFIGEYPDRSAAVMVAARKELKTEKTRLQNEYSGFMKRYNGTWAGKMVQNNPHWFPDPDDPPALRNDQYKNSFWNGVHTTDPELINSPLYTTHILNYLRYYFNPEMQFSEMERLNGIKASIDTIMLKFGENPETRAFALEYLTKGFKEIALEEALQYLDEKYRTVDQCKDDRSRSELEKRLEGYQALKPGSPVPEIRLGNNEGLRSLDADTVLLVFWASGCPHCMEMMPRLNAAMAGLRNTKALAISLDTDPAAYKAVAGSLDHLMHVCDYREWESQPVKDYYIAATPSFFLLDKERKIIGKYAGLDACLEALYGNKSGEGVPGTD